MTNEAPTCWHNPPPAAVYYWPTPNPWDTWTRMWDEFCEWAKSLRPLAVAGPSPPLRQALTPRVPKRAHVGHPNPHLALWA